MNPKFDYKSKEFLDTIENMASKGMTDKSIAWGLVATYGKNLTPQYFNELKNEKDEEGNPTERGKLISEALARGREKINLLVRDTYLKTAIGGKKIKTVVKRYVQQSCHCSGEDPECQQCGGLGVVMSTDKAVMQESDIELAPNVQAMATWLYNHDEEWRTIMDSGKKLDLTSKGGELNKGFKIEIIDKREDVENTDDTSI